MSHNIFNPNPRNHIKTIHEDDKFECNICGKQLSNKSNLKRHVQVHNGQINSAGKSTNQSDTSGSKTVNS